jgi:FkbM family methyltransferase
MIEVIQQKLDSMKEYMELTETRAGEFLIYKNDNVISQSIKLFGEYCHAEVDIMSNYLNEDSHYIDIGTNIGYHAVAVHKETNCNVLGFEPNPKHFAVATYNSKEYDKIQLVNAAASDKRFKFKMKDFDEKVFGNYGDIHKSDVGETEVEAISLDELGIARCHLMKIDVEGHEYETLQGAKLTISKHRPVIMYEAMEWDVWTKCYDFLDERKYKQYWVACRTKPVAETYKKTDENPYGSSTVANILCVPMEKEQPNYLCPVVQYEGYIDCYNRYRNTRIIF